MDARFGVLKKFIQVLIVLCLFVATAHGIVITGNGAVKSSSSVKTAVNIKGTSGETEVWCDTITNAFGVPSCVRCWRRYFDAVRGEYVVERACDVEQTIIGQGNLSSCDNNCDSTIIQPPPPPPPGSGGGSEGGSGGSGGGSGGSGGGSGGNDENWDLPGNKRNFFWAVEEWWKAIGEDFDRALSQKISFDGYTTSRDSVLRWRRTNAGNMLTFGWDWGYFTPKTKVYTPLSASAEWDIGLSCKGIHFHTNFNVVVNARHLVDAMVSYTQNMVWSYLMAMLYSNNTIGTLMQFLHQSHQFSLNLTSKRCSDAELMEYFANEGNRLMWQSMNAWQRACVSALYSGGVNFQVDNSDHSYGSMDFSSAVQYCTRKGKDVDIPKPLKSCRQYLDGVPPYVETVMVYLGINLKSLVKVRWNPEDTARTLIVGASEESNLALDSTVALSLIIDSVYTWTMAMFDSIYAVYKPTDPNSVKRAIVMMKTLRKRLGMVTLDYPIIGIIASAEPAVKIRAKHIASVVSAYSLYRQILATLHEIKTRCFLLPDKYLDPGSIKQIDNAIAFLERQLTYIQTKYSIDPRSALNELLGIVRTEIAMRKDLAGKILDDFGSAVNLVDPDYYNMIEKRQITPPSWPPVDTIRIEPR